MLVPQIPESMVGFMACVILPCSDKVVLETMHGHLMREYQLSYVYTSVPSGTASGEDIYFVRISSQVYLSLSDFELFAAKVKEYLKI